MIQIDFPNGTTASYKYDGLGRRIEKNVNGTITRYIYDGEDIALEYDGANTFVSRYSHGQQTDQPFAVQRAGVGFFYYHSDHQGSITHLTAMIRYIHWNPVQAKLVKTPAAYRWSSHAAYLQAKAAPPWLSVKRVLAGFGSARDFPGRE